MLMVAAPSAEPSRSTGTWKLSEPILIKAICWPLAFLVRLEIVPIEAPVLSFTVSPACSGAGVVALVLAPAVEADGVVFPPGCGAGVVVASPGGGAVVASPGGGVVSPGCGVVVRAGGGVAAVEFDVPVV